MDEKIKKRENENGSRWKEIEKEGIVKREGKNVEVDIEKNLGRIENGLKEECVEGKGVEMERKIDIDEDEKLIGDFWRLFLKKRINEVESGMVRREEIESEKDMKRK